MGPLYNYSSYLAIEQAFWLPLTTKINTFRKDVLGLPALDLSQGSTLIQDRQVAHMYCWSPSVLPKPSDWPGNLSLNRLIHELFFIYW